MVISAILTSHNEMRNSVFWRNVELLRAQTELLIVDGGSQDGTWERFRHLGLYVFVKPGSSRAERINFGLQQTRGDWRVIVNPKREASREDLLALEHLTEPGWGEMASGLFLSRDLNVTYPEFGFFQEMRFKRLLRLRGAKLSLRP